MARLGISIYPEYSTEEQDIAYIRKAGKMGYRRIFTCLLSVAAWLMRPMPAAWKSSRM